MLGREVTILRHFTKLATVVLIALPATAAFAHAEISDPVLAQKISVLLRDVFTGTNEQTTAAQAKIRDLFRARGLPTIAQVGNDTSYDFVLLASLGQPLSFQADVLPAVRAAARKNEIPSDAAIFYLARFRLERMKESADKHAPLNPSLRDQIESLYKIDQAVRQPAGFDKQKMIQTDRKLAPVLKNIFEKYGLPTFAMVGTRAAGEFVIMVQHQSPEFREQVLPKLKAALTRVKLIHNLSRSCTTAPNATRERNNCTGRSSSVKQGRTSARPRLKTKRMSTSAAPNSV